MNLLIAGIDEAGRGPLIGSVVAAAVILDPENPIIGLKDSKKLSSKQRDVLFNMIVEKSLCYAIAEASHEEIDEINILQASLLAMQRAVTALKIKPHQVLIDGKHAPKIDIPTTTLIGGDNLEPAISAASILAKVTRDRQMIALDQTYPNYGFAGHKGYPTIKHRNAIKLYGVLPLHRKTFAGVKEFL